MKTSSFLGGDLSLGPYILRFKSDDGKWLIDKVYVDDILIEENRVNGWYGDLNKSYKMGVNNNLKKYIYYKH